MTFFWYHFPLLCDLRSLSITKMEFVVYHFFELFLFLLSVNNSSFYLLQTSDLGKEASIKDCC